jgi:hypothetical protein
MRRFFLVRNVDVSGISGIGPVAQGCQFDNGWCAMTWLTGHTTLSYYSSIDELEGIHGHGGVTVVEWVDEEEKQPDEDLHQ